MLKIKDFLKVGPLLILIFSLIAYFLGGINWAIGTAILFTIVSINIIFDIIKSDKKDNSEMLDPSFYNAPSDNFKDDECEETKPRNKYIDKIQFEYRTASGNKQTYTVLVYKGLRGDLEGWCIEREGIRTFLPERIVNKEVTKLDTGEVLALKDWRASFRNSKVS